MSMSLINTNFGAIGSLNLPDIQKPQRAAETGNEGFGDVLKNAISNVNQLSGGAEQQIGSLLQGGKGDMSSVMVAVEKADVAFQLMMQVRNKIVSAYQDIEKMQF
jgi:flagellar hook-basal body complex protein FliE